MGPAAVIAREHRYALRTVWTGNRGAGTVGYRAYDRSHRIEAPGKPPIDGSSDPAFRGDPTAWNPEELFVAALSACHQLWYLSLCAEAGVTVTDYADDAEGVMAEEADGGGRFVAVRLRPQVRVRAASDVALARTLHDRAHALCFIARSVDVPVTVSPSITQDG